MLDKQDTLQPGGIWITSNRYQAASPKSFFCVIIAFHIYIHILAPGCRFAALVATASVCLNTETARRCGEFSATTRWRTARCMKTTCSCMGLITAPRGSVFVRVCVCMCVRHHEVVCVCVCMCVRHHEVVCVCVCVCVCVYDTTR